MNVLTPYVAEGIRRRERCFCVQKPEVVKRLRRDLQFIGVDVDQAVETGAVEFHPISEVYFSNGKFEPAVMMEMLERSIEEALRRGFTGFRSAGELSWAVEGRDECDQLIGYEEMVEKSFPGKTATGMCQYPMDAFPQAVLESVLELHRKRVVEPETPSFYSSIRIKNGGYLVEIVADKYLVNPTYYFVVERRLGREIVGWGSGADFERTNEQAENLVRELTARTSGN